MDFRGRGGDPGQRLCRVPDPLAGHRQSALTFAGFAPSRSALPACTCPGPRGSARSPHTAAASSQADPSERLRVLPRPRPALSRRPLLPHPRPVAGVQLQGSVGQLHGALQRPSRAVPGRSRHSAGRGGAAAAETRAGQSCPGTLRAGLQEHRAAGRNRTGMSALPERARPAKAHVQRFGRGARTCRTEVRLRSARSVSSRGTTNV